MDSKIWFRNICKKNSLHISDDQLILLDEYVSELVAWNNKINLISRREEENIWQRQILGSISFLFKFKFETIGKILDLGTGGGLPGIPIAILQPNLSITLLDSIKKKIHVINNILNQLSLPNVVTVCGRAEEMGQRQEFKHTFDYIIARAVAPMVDVVEWSKPLLKQTSIDSVLSHLEREHTKLQKGSVIMLKGGDLESEIKTALQKFPKLRVLHFLLTIEGLKEQDLANKKIVIAYQ